jgi:hypothetical protein
MFRETSVALRRHVLQRFHSHTRPRWPTLDDGIPISPPVRIRSNKVMQQLL